MKKTVERRLINSVILGDCKLLVSILDDLVSNSKRNPVDNIDENNDDHNYNDKNQVSILSKVKEPLTGNTLLHLAVLGCQRQIEQRDIRSSSKESILKIFEILMANENNRIDPFVTNNEGQTPLHLFHAERKLKAVSAFSIVSKTSLGDFISPKKNSLQMRSGEHKCYHDKFLSLAFQGGIGKTDDKGEIDIQDAKGFTALHYAVKAKCSHCIQKLLKYGASMNIKNSKHASMPFVTPQIFNQDPWAVQYLVNRLNEQITDEEFESEDEDFRDKDNEDCTNSQLNFGLSYDFRCIVPTSTVGSDKPQREMEFIETFLNADGSVRKKILDHPLVSTFVFMKWERVRRIYIMSFVLHIALAILYTIFALNVYLLNCPYRSPKKNNSMVSTTPKETKKCDDGFGSFEFSLILLVVAGILALLELLKMLQNFVLYKRQWNNFFQIFMIISMCLSAWPVRWSGSQRPYNWQYGATAYGIFHVWSTLMINMGRFPKLGVYVEMFGKVLLNFGYLMTAYIFLIIAFSISFCVVFPDYPPFETIPRAMLKVITMMSGEVDYGEFFYGQNAGHGGKSDLLFKASDASDLIHPMTAHILYGAFVILVTIVLTNLLIGLAVDDIKTLTQNSEFTKTTREVANISYVESLIFWNRLPEIDPVKRLQKFVFLGKLQEDKQPSKSLKFRLPSINRIGQFAGNFLPTGNRKQSTDAERRQSSKIQLANPKTKYLFRISLDDCKPPRGFPEVTYLKAIELIKHQQDK